MKTIKQIITVIAIAIFMLGSLSAKAQSSKSSPVYNKNVPSNQKVGWFSAGNFGCWGWNFCNGDAPWQKITSKNSITTHQILKFNKKSNLNTMTFSIPLSTMNEKNREFYENTKTFVLEEDQEIDVNQLKEFNLPKGSRYLKGMYPINNDGKNIIFTVSIK